MPDQQLGADSEKMEEAAEAQGNATDEDQAKTKGEAGVAMPCAGDKASHDYTHILYIYANMYIEGLSTAHKYTYPVENDEIYELVRR